MIISFGLPLRASHSLLKILKNCIYINEEKKTFCVLHDVELDVDLSTFGSDNLALATGSPCLTMGHHHKHSNVPVILLKRKIGDLLQKPISSHLLSRNNCSIKS